MKNVKVNGKWDILLPDHRAERPEWYTKKGWERERLDSMAKHIGKKDVVYYVGAEEGDMAALCALWGAKVGLIEPNDKVWPNIKQIWTENKLPDPIFCFSGFASKANVDFARGMSYGFPASADGPVIGDHGFKELSFPQDIPQTRIDDISGYQAIPAPTAISIDVEGSEFEVLRGAEKVLKEHHPKIWLSGHPEFMFKHFGEYMGDLRNWIKDRGYKEKLLAYDHELHFFYS